MNSACPISYEKIDTTTVRLGSIFVSLLLLFYISTDLIFFIYFLVFDILVRILRLNRFSLIWYISKIIQKFFNLPSRSEDAAAKRFTLYLALFFSAFVVFFAWLLHFELALLTALLFASCSLTEAIVGFCVGCKMYQIVRRLDFYFCKRLI